MNKNKPLLSIIIPCYNDVEYVEQAVNSAISQTYHRIEIIVVDDGSDAETKRILKEIEPKIKKLISQRNKGQSSARNVGIAEARGGYVIMLDSDDFLEPDFCIKAVEKINGDDVKAVTCYAKKWRRDTFNLLKPRGGRLKDFLLENQALGASMFRKKDALLIGGYDEGMRNGFEDWEFFIRLLKNGGRIEVVKEPLYNYRVRKESTSSRARNKKYELLKYIYLKHQDLYKIHFPIVINHLLRKIEIEEREKIKNTERLEFKIGKFILGPLRIFKKMVGL